MDFVLVDTLFIPKGENDGPINAPAMGVLRGSITPEEGRALTLQIYATVNINGDKIGTISKYVRCYA